MTKARVSFVTSAIPCCSSFLLKKRTKAQLYHRKKSSFSLGYVMLYFWFHWPQGESAAKSSLSFTLAGGATLSHNIWLLNHQLHTYCFGYCQIINHRKSLDVLFFKKVELNMIWRIIRDLLFTDWVKFSPILF